MLLRIGQTKGICRLVEMRDGGCVADVLVLPLVCKLIDEENLHIS